VAINDPQTSRVRTGTFVALVVAGVLLAAFGISQPLILVVDHLRGVTPAEQVSFHKTEGSLVAAITGDSPRTSSLPQLLTPVRWYPRKDGCPDPDQALRDSSALP
jgi:hypothetical protein